MLKSDVKKFISIGRYSPEKGHDRLIQAFNKIQEEVNSYLIIIGGIFNISSLMVTLRFVLPFIAGMLFGIVGISLLINYLFKWYREETFSLIFGVSVASIFMIVKNLIPFINNGFQVFLMVVLLSVGYLITNKLE